MEMAKASCAFVADLPDMSDEAMERLYTWGKSNCSKFDVHMDANGGMKLVVERKKAGTVREHQRNLKTLLKNWGVALPERQSGWLRIIDEGMDIADEHVPAAPDQEESLARKATSADMSPHTSADINRLRAPINLLKSCAVVRAY